MRRLLVNDCLSALPEHHTFWHDLRDWFDMDFVGGEYQRLDYIVNTRIESIHTPDVSLIIRNCSYFPPIRASERIPTISLLQDIFESGPQRRMQLDVIESSKVVVFNSNFTAVKYIPLPEDSCDTPDMPHRVIPLPVDFTMFAPGNAMGAQQALSLPANCICWVGASQGAAGHVKGFDIFMGIVRANPDLNFVGAFKDAAPAYGPPNLRTYARLTHERLAEVINACAVGLCTSRTESQHLAGIEMGACGLPLVVPPTGTYWKRHDLPGFIVPELKVEAFASALRSALAIPVSRDETREYWRKEFEPAVVLAAWQKLIEEVEYAQNSEP